MHVTHRRLCRLVCGLVVLTFTLITIGCSARSAPAETAVSQTDSDQADGHSTEEERLQEAAAEMLTLPEVAAADLGDGRLQVVATTSIIGDVVAQVGGDAIDLLVLMEPGQDPHSFEPAARDLTAVAAAHVIFVNGWNLEEALVSDLAEIAGGAPLVAVSANIAPLAPAVHEDNNIDGEDSHEQEEEHEHQQGGVDPHVWFSIPNVKQWVINTEQVLSSLDPANADTYASNAAVYLAELEELQEYAASRLAAIPEEKRFLVTNHDSLSYFAHEYDFTLLGTVIPAASTLAEPSASDLAGLIAEMREHAICTIFAEATMSNLLSQTVAGELTSCDTVQVLQIFTGAVGPAGSRTDSYIGMFRANVDAIVKGLQ